MSEQESGISAGEPFKLLNDVAATKDAHGDDLGQQYRTRHRGVSYEKRKRLTLI